MKLTPFRRAGRCFCTFLVTLWPLLSPTAMLYRTAIVLQEFGCCLRMQKWGALSPQIRINKDPHSIRNELQFVRVGFEASTLVFMVKTQPIFGFLTDFVIFVAHSDRNPKFGLMFDHNGQITEHVNVSIPFFTCRSSYVHPQLHLLSPTNFFNSSRILFKLLWTEFTLISKMTHCENIYIDLDPVSPRVHSPLAFSFTAR